ncbi:DUF4396 domain-containing protein [Demequina capsici]|uniref:DUF4396 domain-containing protein n=1 Tax=Demequina capsici TaxID=3075620 RepID=A0AA96F9X8_9MICO|nr:DUF4396 domain-containing protein [Demequina sp. OYTSA14]WNM25868.1 DUF4396 domain-containing protein [Demequina sp. OYTSA14]
MHELHLSDIPAWLMVMSWASLAIGAACAMVALIHVARHPPEMRVMTVVWPVTMLFGSVAWLWFYVRHGRANLPDTYRRPRWAGTATSASHCGAGCAMGDVGAELALAAFPWLAVVVGYGALYQQHIIAAWTWDLVLAFLIGIALQYAAIAPMRRQSRRASLRDAVKADTFSILSWQVGMYTVMGVVQLWLLPAWLGGSVSVLTPVFWAVMQVAMIAGFATAFPVNAMLIRRGVKEAM